jgi:3-deoxy-D-manno-octulosonic-acid transferase
LRLVLRTRAWNGKEEKSRLEERRGVASVPRPDAPLIWIHAASVGEAQSGLVLIRALSAHNPALVFLVTTGTRTSAAMMAKNLPASAIHQYVPLDHPAWVTRFLSYWKPGTAIFLESEIWPNMLIKAHQRGIPLLVVNGRLSDKSYQRWQMMKESAKTLFGLFSVVLTQTEEDQRRFKTFGANALATGNIKLSASPLPADERDLQQMLGAVANRPCWVYASSHDGEEELACRVHRRLAEDFPALLTIIVPRHPARGDEIEKKVRFMGLSLTRRGEAKTLPEATDNIYLADTMGELGLFYRLCPIAFIGRSFSHDGGGGHNPVEAAQLGCAVLTGPHIQFQENLFHPMFAAGASHQMETEDRLYRKLKEYFSNPALLDGDIQKAEAYIASLDNIVQETTAQIVPFLPRNGKGGAA